MEFVQTLGNTDFIRPYQIKGKEALLVSDIHFPNHDKKALNTALSYLPECDTLILNGDILDFHGLSRFGKSPKKIYVKDELNIAREFFETLRKHFKGEILFKVGNHEERLNTFISNQAPALFEVEDIQLPAVLHLKDYNIKLIDYTQFMKFNSLYIMHGHEVRSSYGVVNVARTMFMKTKENIIFGHFHTNQEYIDKSIGEEVKGSWAVACLSDLHPRWNNTNNWVHGFARLSKVNHSHFHVKNYKIIKGKVY